MAEWLGAGLQNLSQWFDSATHLSKMPLSSLRGICVSGFYYLFTTVHGAVSAGAPKVFLKYFYVNTATGEKSGDMYASAKLGE